MDDQAQQKQPLFQNADDQEQAYAPQQVPGDPGVSADAVTGDPSNPRGAPAVPPAAPTSTTAPELTLAAPVDLAARNVPAGDEDRPYADDQR
jgi:hypothetical protein